MACKQSELVSAINSYTAARQAGDGNLIQFAGELLAKFLGEIEFEPEEKLEETAEETPTTEDLLP
jgi:hypothetical protein